MKVNEIYTTLYDTENWDEKNTKCIILKGSASFNMKFYNIESLFSDKNLINVNIKRNKRNLFECLMEEVEQKTNQEFIIKMSIKLL